MEPELMNFIRKHNAAQSTSSENQNVLMVGDFAGFISPAQCGFGNANEVALEKRIVAQWKAGNNNLLLKPCDIAKHQHVQPCYCSFQRFRFEFLSQCHANYFCNGCGEKGICGARYNCAECAFDLCEKCFEAQQNGAENTDAKKKHEHKLQRIVLKQELKEDEGI